MIGTNPRNLHRRVIEKHLGIYACITLPDINVSTDLSRCLIPPTTFLASILPQEKPPAMGQPCLEMNICSSISGFAQALSQRSQIKKNISIIPIQFLNNLIGIHRYDGPCEVTDSFRLCSFEYYRSLSCSRVRREVNRSDIREERQKNYDSRSTSPLPPSLFTAERSAANPMPPKML